MKQTAIVKSVNADSKTAVVRVKRESACESCHNAEFCSGCAQMIEAEVINDVGAREGDTVSVEASSHYILLYSVLSFVVPVIVGIAGYAAGDIFLGEVWAAVISLGGFFAFFLIMLKVSKFLSSRDLEIHITEITLFGAESRECR